MSSISLEWRRMWGLHAIESGIISARTGKNGLAHEIVLAFHKKYGRSVDEIVADHERYVREIEAARSALAIQLATTEEI